jgi:hypothetical protein
MADLGRTVADLAFLIRTVARVFPRLKSETRSVFLSANPEEVDGTAGRSGPWMCRSDVKPTCGEQSARPPVGDDPTELRQPLQIGDGYFGLRALVIGAAG